MDDVVATRRLLLCYLPLELADEIMDRANYHPGLLETYPRSNAFNATLREPTGTQNTEMWCFLITPPIPACENVEGESAINEMISLGAVSGGQAFMPEENESLQVYAVRNVKRITFWISSRGSIGLGSQLEGQIQGSRACYDASILRPMAESSIQATLSHFDDLERGAFKIQATFPGHGLEEVNVDGRQRWTIQESVASKWGESKHVVVWANDNDGSAESHFVSAIRPGDRIAITVKAQYPVWASVIQNISVEILYSV